MIPYLVPSMQRLLDDMDAADFWKKYPTEEDHQNALCGWMPQDFLQRNEIPKFKDAK